MAPFRSLHHLDAPCFEEQGVQTILHAMQTQLRDTSSAMTFPQAFHALRFEGAPQAEICVMSMRACLLQRL